MHLPLTHPVAIFFVVMVIILLAPIIFRRLKVPHIVGLILAGVAVGPYGFNILDRDASFEIFGQVGILFLMFLAAIEIDMYHMRQNIRSGGLFGIITFLIPFVVGTLVIRGVFQSSWATCVLVASMFSSHTLVSYPIVSRFGISNNRGAVIAVCGTIVAVLLSLFVLAEVVDAREKGGFDVLSLLKLIGYMAVFGCVIAWSLPMLTRWFFRKFSDPVTQFIFILAMLVMTSLLAHLIGLEAILGAFYAGLVLNRYIPGRSALMRNISFVGNAIFIPYFLIGVGMLINVHVVFRGWGVGLAAVVMTLTALVTKWIAVAITARINHLNAHERRLVFGLTSGKAAATIAATMIGFQYGLLTEDMMNGAVVMILICCIVASMVTEQASKYIRKDLMEQKLQQEDRPSPGFARQVVAVSNPLTAEGLMRMAVFMRNPDNDEAITALYVRNTEDRRSVSMGQGALAAAVKAAYQMDVAVNETERYDLNIVTGVSNTMRERKATDVIIGLHHKSNIVDSFFGSMTENLLKTTDKMVILVRCFVPVDTIRKLVIYVPRNAEYENGFHSMLARIANLASQLGCRAVFIVYKETSEFIETFIREENFSFRREYREMDSWDDFIILSSQVGGEDLLIVAGARKGSLSYGPDLDNMPSFLSHNFSRNNLAMIYPSQFSAPQAPA